MASIDSYREAVELITEYIYKKHGQEDVSIINMILETKGIPKIVKGTPSQSVVSNASEAAIRANSAVSNSDVSLPMPISQPLPLPVPVQVPAFGGALQQNISGSRQVQHLPISTGASGVLLSAAPNDSSGKPAPPPPSERGVPGRSSGSTTGSREEDAPADNSEDIGERIRDVLRSANSVEELNKAIDMAKSAGLTYEANLGERKLKKLLG
ncbi:hypothetical protein FG386_002861 [Cryptosporidium ryanae]|uniref:uncharacterized protein n=1 Tax=Cryptosporidium ryanae TaxID=515981 RepID=UPI00351A83BE|nr:hypothetical protein FG386_002861 [Cryptosporidium ryanae]